MDQDGNLIPERRENYEAFLYFIDRILPSVNFETNNYNAVSKKTKLLSNCFSKTDEAFALVNVMNYYQRWTRKLMALESRKRERNGQIGASEERPLPHQQGAEWFRAKWTSSGDGMVYSGWKKEGIDEFTRRTHHIESLRSLPASGRMLEEKIRDHWKGALPAPNKRRKKQAPVDAFKEDIFAGFVEI